MTRLDKKTLRRRGALSDDPVSAQALSVLSQSCPVPEQLAALRALAEAGYMPLPEYLRAVEDARRELHDYRSDDGARRDD